MDLTVIKLLVDCPKVYVFTWYFFLNSSKLNTLGYDDLYIWCCCNVGLLLFVVNVVVVIVVIGEGYVDCIDGRGYTG